MNTLLKKIITEVQRFVPRYNHGDLIWEFYLKHTHRWHYIHIQHYNGIYYFSGSDLEGFSTEKEPDLEPKEEVFIRALPVLLREVYEKVKKDSIAYHLWLNKNVSVHLKQGIIPSVFLRELLPEYRRFDKALSKAEMGKMISILQKYKDPHLDKMTANKFFDYCKVAYLANGRKTYPEMNLKSSGFELYDRWADSRDGGLKKIRRDSPKAFEQWYKSDKWSGCHPWEIYRGGNSTHIDMAVVWNENQKKWKILLSAFSSTRLIETCRIAIALWEANMPFELSDSKSYSLRLTANDWIGILPRHHGLSYGWHDFPEDWHVADCMYFSTFKDYSGKLIRPYNEIKGLITWFPLPTVRIKSKN